jgi:hypothetical protein
MARRVGDDGVTTQLEALGVQYRRGGAIACKHRETDATRETPAVVGRAHQLEIREDQAGVVLKD